jgi:hypothetical protein
MAMAGTSIPSARALPNGADWLAFDRNSISVSAAGAHRIEILDPAGGLFRS